jgi:hypothetical protein
VAYYTRFAREKPCPADHTIFAEQAMSVVGKVVRSSLESHNTVRPIDPLCDCQHRFAMSLAFASGQLLYNNSISRCCG